MKTHLDLFSGIGGFSLASSWAGYQTVEFVENNEFCKKILQKNFPNVPIHEDIKNYEGKKHREKIDLLTAGVPCQPASSAGRGLGERDNRWLWPDCIRVIGDVLPKKFIIENVYGLFALGEGLVFENLLVEMEKKDYEIQSYGIGACSIGAPHKRNRIWIVGHLKHDGCDGAENRKSGNKRSDNIEERTQKICESERSDLSRSHASDMLRKGLQRIVQPSRREGAKSNDKQPCGCRGVWSENWTEVAAKFCRMDARISDRMDRIKALGNSIVPQVAYEIIKSL